MKRTAHKSKGGKKRYLVHDKKGRIVDNQSYKRAHASDIKRRAKAEQGE
jgi:hypothetical protein